MLKDFFSEAHLKSKIISSAELKKSCGMLPIESRLLASNETGQFIFSESCQLRPELDDARPAFIPSDASHTGDFGINCEHKRLPLSLYFI